MNIKVLRRMQVQRKERVGRDSEPHYTHTHTHIQSHTIDTRVPVLTLTPNISHYSDDYKCSILHLHE